MKYLSTINEFLDDSKYKYVDWITKSIIKEIKNNNIDLNPDDINYETFDHFNFKLPLNNKVQLKKDISTIEKILNKWGKRCSDVDNIILMYKHYKVNDKTIFVVEFKTIKIARAKPYRYVYHQTPKQNVKSILKDGLIPKDSSKWVSKYDKSLEYPPAIFAANVILDGKNNKSKLFHSMDYTTLVIDTTKIKNIWYVDLNMGHHSRIYNEPFKYIMTFDAIPPEAISVL